MDPYDNWSEARSHIPPGRYHVLCLDAGKPRIWLQGHGGWGSTNDRLVLWFQVVEGPFAKAILPMFINLPPNGRIREGSMYHDAWRIANGGVRPTRGRMKDMSPSKFVQKSFDAEVIDVKPKWIIPGKKKPVDKPKENIYSRVYILYDLVTGNPES